MKRLSYLFLIFPTLTWAQPDIPYYQIPDTPKTYNAGTVAARVVDGLGFRYHWATKDLRPEDLAFRPTPEARTTEETIDHIYGLVLTILNAPQSIQNNFSGDYAEKSFEQKRLETLQNIQKASELLKQADGEQMASFQVLFGSADSPSAYPFWNMLNGPIADAIYHTGQVVTLRRSSGNPINPNISVFSGRLRN